VVIEFGKDCINKKYTSVRILAKAVENLNTIAKGNDKFAKGFKGLYHFLISLDLFCHFIIFT